MTVSQGRDPVSTQDEEISSKELVLKFNDYPQVQSGSEIFVPLKEEKTKLSLTELVSLTTGVASLKVLIINLLR